ncbi:hypothetical protein E4T56_gene676 [Termitomyces sp. T112]|nr:hypothetical protein E4T56_gene676 [Termitomyces sp. T112]
MSYTLCLWHRPVAPASSQTQPHFIWSLYFKLNAKPQTQPHFVWLGPFFVLDILLNASSQTQPHFVQLGPCISNLMLHPRPNLTSFDPTSLCLVRSLYFKLNASSQIQPHFIQLVRSLYFKLNASSQTQPHFVQLGLCISNSMLSPRSNLTSFG